MLVVTCAARANDSAAELSIGGLQFVRTNDIAMQSEDLRISLDRVAVRYQFANTAKFQIDQRAMVGDKDVTAQLDQFKLPLLPIGSREIRVANLPEATRTKLADQGLLMPVRTDDKGHQQYAVAWVAKTSALRQQTFPPERGVIVEHQYRPSVWRAGVRSRPPPPYRTISFNRSASIWPSMWRRAARSRRLSSA